VSGFLFPIGCEKLLTFGFYFNRFVISHQQHVGLGIFLFTATSSLALEPTQPPIQQVPRALSLGVNRLGRETDQTNPSSAEVKNAWRYTSTPPIRLHGVVLS
jgi:hypothetical protein